MVASVVTARSEETAAATDSAKAVHAPLWVVTTSTASQDQKAEVWSAAAAHRAATLLPIALSRLRGAVVRSAVLHHAAVARSAVLHRAAVARSAVLHRAAAA